MADEKQRAPGVTMDQRKRLMLASKLGIGPMKVPGSADRSRSPPDRTGATSSSVDRGSAPSTKGASPGRGSSSTSHVAPSAEQRFQQLAAARAKPARRHDDDEGPQDLSSFLAGGRAIAAKAAKERAAKEEAMALAAANAAAAQAAAAQAERERQARREEEERLAEEERKKQERKRQRQEEKKRRKEEKQRQRADTHEEEEDDRAEDSDEAYEKRKLMKGLFKAEMRNNDDKRKHWGESVKGRVSSDYKGMTDADLERRFGMSHHNFSGEKLMTEEEVLRMMKKGRK